MRLSFGWLTILIHDLKRVLKHADKVLAFPLVLICQRDSIPFMIQGGQRSSPSVAMIIKGIKSGFGLTMLCNSNRAMDDKAGQTYNGQPHPSDRFHKL